MQTHLPTGRLAAIVRAGDFQTPVSIEVGRYVLVIAREKPFAGIGIKTARAWVDAGASYICAWGSDSSEVEDSFDYAAFLPEYGGELPFTLMTTAHHEQIEEALWFAFYCAKDEEVELNAVVIVVDSEELEKRCREWLKSNKE